MLAIVIPYYKIDFFEATLQSLANQTDKRFVVYIGDDASPENPCELLENYKEKFNFTYKRFEKNLGEISLVQQWNRCIAMTDNEEWLMILGDDDKLGKNVVEEFHTNYNIFNGKSNVIRFSTEVIDGKSENLPQSYLPNPLWENAIDAFVRRIKILSRSTLSEYVFSKKAFVKFGFRDYPLAWHSDDMAWLELSDSQPIYAINSATVSIRISAISISGNMDNLPVKQLASVLFYKDILNEKLHLFEKEIRLELMLIYEINIKKIRKLNVKEWKLLYVLYVKNFKTIPFLKFFRRIILANFK